MAQVTVYLGLGSNLGDRQANLETAIELLARATRLRATSSVYETAPWGYRHQPHFLNCACVASTDLSPGGLLELTHEVERSIGRRPSFRYGPRLIDMDILLYGDQVYRSPTLQIPHPGLTERAFVLVPLTEVAGDVVHPVLKKRMADLATRVEGKETVKLWGPPIPLPSATG